MPTATLLFQNRPHYRVDAFTAGLRRTGYDVQYLTRKMPEPGDLLVVWNRMRGRSNTLAEQWMAAGADVLVAENGYIGKDRKGEKLFALALDHHLGCGRWHVGGKDRWKSQNIELHPWRKSGHDVLMLPQRGIGEPGVAMPSSWTVDTTRRLKRLTDRPVRMRRHPGAIKHEPYADFYDCHAVVTWASGAAIKALCYGLPVFYGLDGWIAGSAGLLIDHVERECGDLESPLMCDDRRLSMIERLAWAQWSVAEIESGQAIDWIMNADSGL